MIDRLLGRMSRADRAAWRQARTLTDLGELTARWLEGDIASQPGYAPGHGPDPETTDLIPVLAAVNRAGYLTDCSQPGVPPTPGYRGVVYQQRAAVSGFATSETVERLDWACELAGLTMLKARPGHGGDGVVVTETATRQGWWRPYTAFGCTVSADELRALYAGCSDEAIGALTGAWQVSVIDPEWGRNDLLWPVLNETLTAEAKFT